MQHQYLEKIEMKSYIFMARRTMERKNTETLGTVLISLSLAVI